MYRRSFIPLLAVGRSARETFPCFDIYNIADEAEHGRMIRVSYVGHGHVLVSHYPQLGPRKTDPNDPQPQFDLTKRQTIKFRPSEVAEIVCVAEGRIPFASFNYATTSVAYQRDKDDAQTYILTVHKAGIEDQNLPEVSLKIPFSKHFVVMWHQFLDNAVRHSFGFEEAEKPH
eukprot:PhM_4_TR12877/c0_g1_i1/m.77290